MQDNFAQSSSFMTMLRTVFCLLGAHSPLSGAHPGAEVWGGGSVPLSAFRGSWEGAALCSPRICSGEWLQQEINSLKGLVPKQKEKSIQTVTQ